MTSKRKEEKKIEDNRIFFEKLVWRPQKKNGWRPQKQNKKCDGSWPQTKKEDNLKINRKFKKNQP